MLLAPAAAKIFRGIDSLTIFTAAILFAVTNAPSRNLQMHNTLKSRYYIATHANIARKLVDKNTFALPLYKILPPTQAPTVLPSYELKLINVFPYLAWSPSHPNLAANSLAVWLLPPVVHATQMLLIVIVSTQMNTKHLFTFNLFCYSDVNYWNRYDFFFYILLHF